MLLKYTIVPIIYVSIFLGYAQDKQHTPKSHIAYKTLDAIVVDGKADERSWKKAIWSDAFIDIKGKKTPLYNTKVKMLWDDTYFYILAELEEPHVWGDITKHDAIMFHNNNFEIFIDPEGK